MTEKDKLKSTFTTYWEYLTLRTACQLNLFDLIEEGKTDLETLANCTQSQKKPLKLILDALLMVDALQMEDFSYKLSPKGTFLTANHPESMKQAAILWGSEHLSAWQNLDSTIRTGQPSFELIYGKSFFDYLAENPTKLSNYHGAMDEYARDDYKQIGKLLDLKSHKCIMDVGGGMGALLKNIQTHFPKKNLYLFDRPEVIALAKSSADIITIEGDFFNKIPNLSDGIFLSRIIHDWPDEKAIEILQNCHHALPKEGKLYLIENMKNRIDNSAALLSLNMAVMCQSFERSFEQYISLLNHAGFKFLSSIQINPLQWAITTTK